MESKHKNALIGALLAVVFVMAVGYAAFAQQLTINGTAEITSNWDVHMVQNEDGHTATATPASSMGTPSDDAQVTVNGGSGVTATLSASLTSPGDTVTYVIPIKNAGDINAKYDGATMSGSDFNLQSASSQTSATSTSGNIKYEITKQPNATLDAGEWDTVEITLTYLSYENQQSPAGGQETAQITINLNYSQNA